MQHKKTQVMILWATRAQQKAWKGLAALRVPEIEGRFYADEELAMFSLPGGATQQQLPPAASRTRTRDARRAKGVDALPKLTATPKWIEVVSQFIYLGNCFKAH